MRLPVLGNVEPRTVAICKKKIRVCCRSNGIIFLTKWFPFHFIPRNDRPSGSTSMFFIVTSISSGTINQQTVSIFSLQACSRRLGQSSHGKTKHLVEKFMFLQFYSDIPKLLLKLSIILIFQFLLFVIIVICHLLFEY